MAAPPRGWISNPEECHKGCFVSWLLSAFPTSSRNLLPCPMSYSSFKARFKGHLLWEALLDYPALAPPTSTELPLWRWSSAQLPLSESFCYCLVFGPFPALDSEGRDRVCLGSLAPSSEPGSSSRLIGSVKPSLLLFLFLRRPPLSYLCALPGEVTKLNSPWCQQVVLMVPTGVSPGENNETRNSSECLLSTRVFTEHVACAK